MHGQSLEEMSRHWNGGKVDVQWFSTIWYYRYCHRVHVQVTIIGREAWIRGCCGYGQIARGLWCLRTQLDLKTRSPGPAGVCGCRQMPRLKCTRTRAPNAATGTGTCASTRRTPRTRRWPGYIKRWKVTVDNHNSWERR